MSDFDAEAARTRYATDETDDLVKIAYVDTDRYVKEAVALAREELARRGIQGADDQRATDALTAVQQEDEGRRAVEQRPLGTGYKAVCFILADIIAIIIAVEHHQAGKRRAAREALRWMGYGWILRIGLFLVIMLPIWRQHGFS